MLFWRCVECFVFLLNFHEFYLVVDDSKVLLVKNNMLYAEIF